MNSSALPPIAFIDLAAQQARIGGRIEEAIRKVLSHGGYILGPEVQELERQLSDFCGAAHTITCANGTDALTMVLMAHAIGPGDALIVPSFTFAATAEVVAQLGATPIFVDVDAMTFNMDPSWIERALDVAARHKLKTQGVIAVDLFGQPADYTAIEAIAARHGLFVIADAAQSFGARHRERRVGQFGRVTTTSFFPAKPLGCYGDGGAIFTDDPELATVLKSLRVHGQGSDKYDNVRIGLNGRLDTIQAAILLEKLAIFEGEIIARNRVAQRYAEALGERVRGPQVLDENTCVWAQYTIRVNAARRADIVARLKADGVPTAIYYPRPLHCQTAYRHFPIAGNGLPVSETIASEVLSLPMHPYLDEPTQDRITRAVLTALH